MSAYEVVVAGATGLVGQTLIRVLEERNFPVGRLWPLASNRPGNRTVTFKNQSLQVLHLANFDFSQKHFAFFCVGPEISEKFVPKAVEAGCIGIDNSSAFRRKKEVPIIVPEVNAHKLNPEIRLIANPNCSTAQLVVALYPLHQLFGLRRVVVSTYQSVSGSGMIGLEQLEAERQGREPESRAYSRTIFNNCLAQIGNFTSDGLCQEEQKMVYETRKILGLPNLIVAPTTVRIPIPHCHSEAVLVEFKREVVLEEAKCTLKQMENVIFYDTEEDGTFPMPLEVKERDQVFVGRLRKVENWPNALQFWVVADNLRKGAASNAVQIAEKMIEKGFV